MRRQAIMGTVLVALVSLAAGSASAVANPLLSGYGGPGAGAQTILGASLLGGPEAGGGSSPGPGEGSATGQDTSTAGRPNVRSGVPDASGGRARRPIRRRGPDSSGRRSASPRPSALATTAGAAAPFGATDVIWLLVGAAGLTLLAFGTRRLAR